MGASKSIWVSLCKEKGNDSMQYLNISWRNGYRSVIGAREAFSALEELRAKNGNLEPTDVVEVARSEDNALHEEIYRETDEEAAYEFRLERARLMMRSIEVVRIDAPALKTRAYTIVREPIESKPHRVVYTSEAEALADPATRAEVIERALKEINSWRKRYAVLQELAKIHAMLEQAIPEVKKSLESEVSQRA